MADRTILQLPDHPDSAATQEAPSITNLKPLDLVFLPASIRLRADARLYVVDRDVAPGVSYDYLLSPTPPASSRLRRALWPGSRTGAT